MIKLKQPIIVEGKYDKITLENIVDTLIITTDGFGIFKNREKCEMLRTLAQKNGIIVMTDSDSAGNMIRAYIKKILGDCEIINVYAPCLSGKEKRKSKQSKEGLLGVEGMSAEVITEALKRSGIVGKEIIKKEKTITKTDFYLAGLSGAEASSQKRKQLLKYLDLPESLSSNAMLDVINTLFTYDEFIEEVEKWQEYITAN